MRQTRLLSAALIAAMLMGCQTMQDGPKQTMGTLVGAGLGALAGSQVGSGKGQMTAIALGTLLGAWLGNETGRSLDAADRMAIEQTTHRALEHNSVGTTSSWRNPNTGRSGTSTPVRTYRTAQGFDCKDFVNTLTGDGKTQEVPGRACRQPDGTWKLVR